jgi:hypothetical protein
MTGRNKYYILALALLIVIAAWFYFSNHNETFHQGETAFALTDTSEISSFQINTSNSSLTIFKVGNAWQFDSGYLANQSLLAICFKVFSQVEIKSPVSKKEKFQVIEKLKNNGTEIILLNNKKVLKNFYLWADTSKKSIYMMQKKAESPFIVDLPSYNGNFAAIFRTEKDFWRDKTIIRYLSGQIANVKVEQPGNQSQSFGLTIYPALKAKLTNSKNIKIQNINAEAVEAYLFCYRNVRVFKFLKKTDLQYQNLSTAQPDFIVAVSDRTGKTKILKTYKRKIQDELEKKTGEKYDLNYCFVTIDNHETALARYVDIDPLTRDLGFFIKK